MKKMDLRQVHVLVLKPKSLLLSGVRFLLLVFLPTLIELNNNKKSNQNYEDHQHCEKKKMSPRVFSSLSSVFWSPDVESPVELKTFLEGGEKVLMLLLWPYFIQTRQLPFFMKIK